MLSRIEVLRTAGRCRASVALCVALCAGAGCSSTEDPSQPSLPACTEATVAPLGLDETHCVISSAPLPGGVPAAAALSGEQLYTFAPKDGRAFTVRRWPLQGADALGASEEVQSFTAQLTDELYPSEFLAVREGTVAVGYNTMDFTNPRGAVLWIDAGAAGEELSAGGNYDAVFFDGDTLLVDGLGAGELTGQAVYALRRGHAPQRLISGLGDNSAPLLLGTNVLLAGGYYLEEGKTKIFGFTRSAVAAALSAGAELSADRDGVLVAEGNFLDGAALDDDLVVIDADDAFTFAGVSRIPVRLDGETLTADPPTAVVLPAADGAGEVKRLTSDGGRLGLLLTDAEGAAHLAVIRKALTREVVEAR